MFVFWMRSDAGAPAMTAMALFPQSRDLTRVTVIAPEPSGPTEWRSTLNSVPPVVMPHGEPTSDASTVYAPPPSSVIWSCVLEKPLNHVPRWMLAAGLEQSASLLASSWNDTVSPRAGVASPRVYSTGTLTHGWAVEMASPLVFAATLETGGELKMSME